MDTFDKCPKKYHYRYIEKLRIDKPAWNFTEFGSCAHLILELFHKRVSRDTNPDEYSKIMSKCFREAVCDKQFDPTILRSYVWSPDGDKEGFEYLKEISQDYLFLMKEKGLPNVVGVEIGYDFELAKGINVRGYIDRIDKISDTHYKVVDYKTSKSARYLKPFQLLVYALAIKRMHPEVEEVSGSFMLLKHGFREIDYSFGTMDIENTFNSIIKTAGLIRGAKSWPKKPTRLCDYCDYNSICLGKWTEEDNEG